MDYEAVIVGYEFYGSIKSGGVTDYKSWPVAYRYAFVSLNADGSQLKIQPFDFVGETPLKKGHYTYKINLEDGQLWMSVSSD